jgi:hypothetical protein
VFKRKAKSDKPAAKPEKAAKKRGKAAKPVKAKAPKPARKPRGSLLATVKKQPTDIFTVMLIISLAAVLIACVLLVLELNRFGSYPWWKAN